MDSSTEITSVGFAHAAYTKGHMFTQFFDLMPENIPEKLAVTGKEAGAFFQRNGIAKSKIVVVGTDRFHRLTPGLPATLCMRAKTGPAEKTASSVYFLPGI